MKQRRFKTQLWKEPNKINAFTEKPQFKLECSCYTILQLVQQLYDMQSDSSQLPNRSSSSYGSIDIQSGSVSLLYHKLSLPTFTGKLETLFGLFQCCFGFNFYTISIRCTKIDSPTPRRSFQNSDRFPTYPLTL